MRMNISVPDQLAEEVRQRDISISAVCQRALRDEVARLRRTGAVGEMEKITVNVGDPSLTIGFTGRWLLEPDSGKTRTSDEGWDNGVFWGVALTQRGRIAVFAEHCSSGAGRLDDYDNLDQASARVPADIIARAAASLGETRVLWRDI